MQVMYLLRTILGNKRFCLMKCQEGFFILLCTISLYMVTDDGLKIKPLTLLASRLDSLEVWRTISITI